MVIDNPDDQDDGNAGGEPRVLDAKSGTFGHTSGGSGKKDAEQKDKPKEEEVNLL